MNSKVIICCLLVLLSSLIPIPGIAQVSEVALAVVVILWLALVVLPKNGLTNLGNWALFVGSAGAFWFAYHGLVTYLVPVVALAVAVSFVYAVLSRDLTRTLIYAVPTIVAGIVAYLIGGALSSAIILAVGISIAIYLDNGYIEDHPQAAAA